MATSPPPFLEFLDHDGESHRVTLKWPGAEIDSPVYQHRDGRLLLLETDGYLVDNKGNRFLPRPPADKPH